MPVINVTEGEASNPIAVTETVEKTEKVATSLLTPTTLDTGGYPNETAVNCYNKIRRASLKAKYDPSVTSDQKADAAKLVLITKHHGSPSKEERVTQLIEDTIQMGIDTGEAKEMMIAELGSEM